MSRTPRDEPRRSWRRPLVRVLLFVGLVVGSVSVIRGVAGDIDWQAVAHAVGDLDWWQGLLLFAVLVVRQALNALPLSIYIKGCTPFKAFVTDQTAVLMTTFAPPPTDLVMRVAMFKSWGISPAAGLAGTAMNTVTFYVVRFGAPLLGIGLMLVTGAWHLGELPTAVASIAVSVAILLLAGVALRRRENAIMVGTKVGRIVQRIRPKVDPEAWGQSVAEFRGFLVDGISSTLPRSVLALVAMVLTDSALLVMSIRFTGLPPRVVPSVAVLTAFLVAYPLTLFPFAGLGILDAVVISTLVAEAGDAAEPGLVAAFLVWRAVTTLLPLLFGAVSLLGWRWTTRDSASGPDQPVPWSNPGGAGRA